MGKIKLKPEFAAEIRAMLDRNDPEGAAESLKATIKAAQLGPDESVLIHDPIPKELERWLKRYAKDRGFRVSLTGRSYRYHISTRESQEAERRRREEEARAFDEMINSPG
jgi:hypothetical protein